MSEPILSILEEGDAQIRVHLIGVAGSGMSGIAGLLMDLGHIVSGSDKVRTKEVDRLVKKGLIFSSPHTAEAIQGVDMVVYSSAVKAGNLAYDGAMAEDIMRVRWGPTPSSRKRAVATSEGCASHTSLGG